MSYGAGTGAGISGATETQAFIPQLWAEIVEGFLRRKLMFADLVDDYSAMAQGTDTIKVPTISEVGVQDKSENGIIEFDSVTESNVSLSINKHKYASKMFEKVILEKVQNSQSMTSKYAEGLAYALAKAIDTDVATELTGNAGLGATLATDDVMTDAEIEAMLATLGENDLDYRDGALTFVVNPTLYADLLANPKFVRYDALGRSNIPTGRLGEIFGIPVEMSNALGAGGTNVSGIVFHKTACAIAIQQGIEATSQYDIDYMAEKVVFDCMYGVKMIHANRAYKLTNAS